MTEVPEIGSQDLLMSTIAWVFLGQAGFPAEQG
jgi:hypothetical protein